jgi:predicted ATPase
LRILSAELHDYLSFHDCEPIEFREGINLIVGVNNSGKSALLKALNPGLPTQANRNEQRFRAAELRQPRVTLTVRTTGERFKKVALEQGSIYIPVEPGRDAQEYGSFFFSLDQLEVSLVHHGSSQVTSTYPGHGLFVRPPAGFTSFHAPPSAAFFVRNVNGDLEYRGTSTDEADSFSGFLQAIYHQDMFYFSAERLNVGESPYADAKRLSHNADNLAAVLATLQGSKGSTFDRLKQHLRGIFPTFGNLSIRPKPGQNIAEIVIWPTEAMDEPELGFPLSESGTGVGQVLAILSVVMTTNESVIIIDEINSFLHPGAVKTLLRLLQTEYSHHQYIVSTHSPEVISVGNPSTLHLVQRDGYRSSVRRLDLEKVWELRELTRELGISMSDVFAADRIIWVEGPTEEICFPEIYKFETKKSVPAGCKIVAVSDTGRLTGGKNKEAIFQLYRSLAEKAAPLVSNVKFSLDSEALTLDQKTDLARAASGSVEFLPRRHLECYLINAASIADFVAHRHKEASSDASVPTANEVEAALKDLAVTPKFKVTEWRNDLEDKEWLARVDAANLIIQVCTDVSETRVTFNKNRDTLLLLQLVIKNNPAQLAELGEYVRRLVDGQG